MLTVEDGSGVDGADAYAARAAVLAYWEKRADAAFASAASDDIRDAAIRRATQFIDIEWGPRFKGSKVDDAQALEWPRENADPFSDSEIPGRLVEATAELAKIALSGPIAGQGASGQAPSESQIASMRAGSVEIAYRESIKVSIESDHTDKFYLVERLLRPLLSGGGRPKTSR